MSAMTKLSRMLRYSTPVVRIWLPVLFIIRVLTLFFVERSVWKDEEAFFQCNTQQPGCKTTCFDAMHPVSHPQYWFLQLVFVSAPTLLWIFYSMSHPGQQTASDENCLSNESLPENNPSSADYSPDFPRAKRYYILSLTCKLLLECSFLVGQWYLIGFTLSSSFSCMTGPCPFLVDCFYPNTSKKNIFIMVMASQAGLSVLLVVLELLLLICKKLCSDNCERQFPIPLILATVLENNLKKTFQ